MVDLVAAARALGYRHAARVDDLGALASEIAALRVQGGPSLLDIRVKPGGRPDLGRPTCSPAEMKRAFMAALR